jgi:NTF2 fold immunity protein
MRGRNRRPVSADRQGRRKDAAAADVRIGLISMECDVPDWWPMSGLDLIPDAETALKIGRVILERYYGDSLVRRYEPYHATRDPINAEEWVVAGSREDKSTAGFGGGFPGLSIDRKDARVTRIALSK